jgi:hypothetical protein
MTMWDAVMRGPLGSWIPAFAGMTMEAKWERLRGRVPLIRLHAETHLATFSHKGRRKKLDQRRSPE